jgi:Thoeris protein ThsB, TIR-like domain
MARRVFFSFHYQRDIFRVNQIRNIPQVMKCSAAGFQDASLWERAKRTSDQEIYNLIDNALNNTTVTVICIGNQSKNRKFINYEINQSIKRGNGLVGIQIHNLVDHHGNQDNSGGTPPQIEANGFNVYKYVNVEKLANRIEEAYQIARG